MIWRCGVLSQLVSEVVAKMDNSVIPLQVMQWAKDEWVSRFLIKAGIQLTSMLTADPDVRLSHLGSRMLHLATMSPHRPSTAVTKTVIEFLIVERKANVNTADDYGRTPLSHFIMSGAMSWHENESFGCEVLELLLSHGADANALFTPDLPDIVGCDKWTLAHALNYVCARQGELPLSMREILEPYFDRSICDSTGRNSQRVLEA